MTKSFEIHWMTPGGNWRSTSKQKFGTLAAAKANLRINGLCGNPAYRIVEVQA